MSKPSGAHDKLADRLANILIRLNQNETLQLNDLANDYKVGLRTIQRDISRFSMLDIERLDGNRIRLNKSKQGHLSPSEIRRIISFASLQHLFPAPERAFFQEQLTNSITIKGYEYENISHREAEFNQINHAIEQQREIEFDYQKVGSTESKHYRLAPYHLVNKNGIWYLIGTDAHKQKTYCFSQISNLQISTQTFHPDPILLAQIRETDSIYHGNQIKEIIIKISARAAGYFLRRSLLPNQEIIRKLDDGSLLLACKNIHPNEVIPIVQYWIPHAHIVSPEELQTQLEQTLINYLPH